MIKLSKKIERQTISTSLKVDLMARLKEISEKQGIPINRLIEVSLEKYLKQTWVTPEQKNKGF